MVSERLFRLLAAYITTLGIAMNAILSNILNYVYNLRNYT